MKKIVVLFAAAILTLTASAQEASKPYESFIQTNGIAEIDITPDEFDLSILINERDSKGKISVDMQQKQMIAALKGIGINIEKQLKIVDMSSQFYKKNNTLSLAEYQLKLTTPEMVAKVYAALDNLGISNVEISKISNSRIEEYKKQARIESMKNAKANAEILAQAIGQKIGKCFYIYDHNNDFAPIMMYANSRSMSAKDDAMAEERMPLEFKNIKLKYSVQVKFVLE